MVDWQFTVFCRKVVFVEIYAFLVVIFLAKYVSLLFSLLFPSLLMAETRKLCGWSPTMEGNQSA